jgi:ubiquitin carboxyl-terminal hydrolase 25/28
LLSLTFVVVEELQQLFRELKSAPTKSVKPTQDLAELTLFSTATEANFRRASINSPSGLPSIASLIEGPVYGPELPPPLHVRPFPLPAKQEDDIVMVDRPSREITDRDDSSSDATLVDMETVEQNEAPVSNGIELLDASGNEKNADDHTEKLSTKVQEHTESAAEYSKDIIPPISVTSQLNMTDQERDEVMANGTSLPPPSKHFPSPDRPPPVPPRNKPAPINTSGESESLRAQKLYFGAQQDVTEVIGNVMFRLQCAIKPTSIDPKFGEQIDSIRETFFGANAVCTKIGETYNEKVEDWANIIVFPDPDGPRKLYDALDVVFDEQVVEIHKSSTTQYASIRKLPPIVQIQIQRTQFNPTTQQASKNQNRIIFEETIYLDRYMDSDRVMQRRKEAWKWKNRLRKLEARQRVLQTTPAEIPVPEALNATKNFLNMLEEEVEDISVGTTLCEALEERAAEIRQELDAITEETTNIKKRLQDQFTDMREHRYRLQAVFMHRGTSAYGHYWIYIYDFPRDIWREYNDDRVSEVRDTKQIFEQDGTSGPTPYYLVYVRDHDKDDLVDAVCREIVEELAANEVQGWAGEMEDKGVMMENGVQHIENTHAINPRSRSDLEVAGAGQWDTPNSRSEDIEW